MAIEIVENDENTDMPKLNIDLMCVSGADFRTTRETFRISLNAFANYLRERRTSAKPGEVFPPLATSKGGLIEALNQRIVPVPYVMAFRDCVGAEAFDQVYTTIRDTRVKRDEEQRRLREQSANQ